jgi:DNA repair protein RecN (Recombination protein N)
MLTDLHIRDFAIIDDLHLEFGAGFIAFTGETGAGKSIIVDAVELLLGGRAETHMVRADAQAAWIEGTFEIEYNLQPEIRRLLEPEGLLDDVAHLTLGRELRREGRNICRINGRTVTLSLLRDTGERLVDVHGQSEHLSLLRVPEHIDLLDRFAHTEDQRQAFRDRHEELAGLRRQLDELRAAQHDATRRAEFLAFQTQEIEAARLRPSELEALMEERTRLANAEQLAQLAEQAVAALDESPETGPSATDRLGDAAQALASLARVDGSLQSRSLEAQALVEQATDLAKNLRLYRESIEFNPRRLDEVEERIGLLRNLMRKYGESIEAVLAFADRARQEHETLVHAEERTASLETEEGQLLIELGAIGAALSAARRRAGDQLAAAIEAELDGLRMAGARFGLDMTWADDEHGVPLGDRRVAFTASGLDRVEFLVAPNPGEGLKPLAKIASGGETSRLMLGLKSVLARADRTPTLIFDEIDQGIGGRVGAIVGRKLWGLARAHQVLCVSHLPQLAAYGDQHFRVEKHVQAGRTRTVVRALAGEERVTELAQMLGGEGKANLQSAAELLSQAATDTRDL